MDDDPEALPLALSALRDLSLAFQISANRSPPMPVDMGSTTFRVAAAAIAASTALPPLISIFIPDIAASGWLVATIPLRAITGER